MIYDVIVIGGGPSGLMAAISAAENGAKTMLIEKGNKLGNKLAISGGGRCNVTNRLPKDEVIQNIPGNGKFLYSAFSIFNNDDIIDYFENLGVALKEEDHGRMFPVSNSAKSVVDTLINHLKSLGATIQINSPVEALQYGEKHHTVILENGTKETAHSVVIAVGGMSVPHTGSTGDGYAWAKAAGHTITELYPTEVPLTSKERFIQERTLQGLSLRDVALTVYDKNDYPIITHKMDLIFTHFGISGPAALRCSQFVVKKLIAGATDVLMAIDTLPQMPVDELEKHIAKLVEENNRRTFKNSLKGIVPERLLHYILEQHNVNDDLRCANVSNQLIHQIAHSLKRFSFYVHGSLPIERSFVTGGGVNTNEIVPSTMQSKRMPRLFFCGEILNIHGYTGGYNITAALVTGRVAGKNSAYEAFANE